MKFKRIAIDTSKHVFTLHGVDEQDRPILRRDLKRAQLEAFFKKQRATEVVLEACGGSHHWGRVLGAMGHQVRLIPPQYVKPFVKRSKNDRHDAEAISEAAARPGMRTVAVKSVDQQAECLIVKHYEMLVKQRTQAINALRGHAAEFGVIAARGTENVVPLLAELAANQAIPAKGRAMLAQMGSHIAALDERIAGLEADLVVEQKANPMCKMLQEMPGVGPVIATTMVMTVRPEEFVSGRHFAAWLGLTPKQHSTGGKAKLGRISKAGPKRLRSLLVEGAMSMVQAAAKGSKKASRWLLELLERKPRKVAAVALANKMARTIWAMMAHGEAYRQQPANA